MALSRRLLPGTLVLHDVRDVEAHVRTLLERELALSGSHLTPDMRDKALTYLISKCWELSGLQQDGRSPRLGTRVTVAGTRITIYDVSAEQLDEADGDEPAPVKRGTFPSSAAGIEWAHARVAQLERQEDELVAAGAATEPRRFTVEIADNVNVGRRWFPRADAAAAWTAERWPGYQAITEHEVPPPGAYDRARGLSFSTYSRRILEKRVVDWFRSELGDSRYAQRPHEVSLEAAAARHDAGGEAGEQFLDLLTPPSHDDPYEEVLTRVSLTR